MHNDDDDDDNNNNNNNNNNNSITKCDISRLWDCNNVKMKPLVIGELGTVSQDFEKFVECLGVDLNFSTLQEACLLGIARMLRGVLDT